MARRQVPTSDSDDVESTSVPGFLSRRGPFLLVGITALLVASVIAFGYFTSEDEVILEVATTTSAVEEPVDTSITYPLSYSQATAAGTVDTIEWGERCDTSTGRLAVPDFFAPECMAPFSGDNGGSTSMGVSSETIKIVQYQVADNDPIRTHLYGRVGIDDTGEQQSLAISDLLAYYRQFYEFYGRSVEIVTYQSRAAANDDAAARADAQRIAEQIQPFAVIGGPALTNAFAEELADRKIVCIDCGVGSTQWHAARAPYLWSTDASGSQKQIHLAEFVQKQLVGKPAAFGGEAIRATPRVFGHVFLDRGPESILLSEQMTAQLEAVGAKPVESIPYTLEPEKMAEKAAEIIARLKAAGVTTVVLSTDAATPRELTFLATEQDYFPEWLVAGASQVDSTLYGRRYDQKQWIHAFGVTTTAARLQPASSNYRSVYEWFMGRPPYADETIETLIPPFAFLMSAIQSAGPNLTVGTLGGALRSIATQQAVSQPFFQWSETSVWTDGDFSGIDDATLFWWNGAATGADERNLEGTGMVAYADGGKRYLPGAWPAEERSFVAEGAVTILAAVPAGEERPSYPRPSEEDATTQPEATEPASTEAPPATDGAAIPGE